jgi:hypothetical protein
MQLGINLAINNFKAAQIKVNNAKVAFLVFKNKKRLLLGQLGIE